MAINPARREFRLCPSYPDRVRRLPLLLLCVLPALAACDSTAKVLPPPPPTSTTIGDSVVEEPGVLVQPLQLASVAGKTTTTVAIGPGSASLSGRVLGPGGAVGGATVRLERIVGGGSASRDVTADEAGNWTASDIKGGRYRVRAWRSPDLAQTKPDIFFLTSTEQKKLDLRITAFGGGLSVSSSVSPNPPISGQSATITVTAASKSVDASGVVRSAGGSGTTLELFATTSGSMRLESASLVTANSSGRGTWRVRCASTGPGGLTVRVNGTLSFAVNVAACTSPAQATTTTSTGETTTTTS